MTYSDEESRGLNTACSEQGSKDKDRKLLSMACIQHKDPHTPTVATLLIKKQNYSELANQVY